MKFIAGTVSHFISFLNSIFETDTKHQKAHPQQAWYVFAQTHNLEFVPGFLKTFDRDTHVTGTYYGHPLLLEVVECHNSTRECTRLTLATNDTKNVLNDIEPLDLNRPITAEDVTHFLSPNGFPDEWRGRISANAGCQNIYFQTDGIEDSDAFLQDVIDYLCDLSDAYPGVVASGGKAVPALQEIASSRNPLQDYARRLLQDISWETTNRLRERQSRSLCPVCLTYCDAHPVKLSGWSSITYYGCRTCGQSNDFIDFEGRITVVLDRQMPVEQTLQDSVLYINWFAHGQPFDFDDVEIVRATDEDVERFAVCIGNDTDPKRKSHYKQMSCTVSSDCALSINTVRILQQMFGQVQDNPLQK